MTADELERLPLACRWGPGDPLRLVTVGRLTSGKNVRAIIEALPRILDQQPGATVDIVGDGPERVLLIELSKRLGLEEKVRFHGNVSHDQVLEILCSSSLFVFPTQVAEGCPKAVVEALACSLPVVASAVSIVPLLLREGAGVLLEDGSASGVAAGVLAAVSSGASYRRMAEQAHESPRALTLEAWRDGIGECLEEEWGPLTVDSALRSTSYFPNLSSHASEKGADHGAPPVPGRALPFDRESDS